MFNCFLNLCLSCSSWWRNYKKNGEGLSVYIQRSFISIQVNMHIWQNLTCFFFNDAGLHRLVYHSIYQYRTNLSTSPNCYWPVYTSFVRGYNLESEFDSRFKGPSTMDIKGAYLCSIAYISWSFPTKFCHYYIICKPNISLVSESRH